MSWTLVAKPVRGATTDGFTPDGTGDGFYTREHTDGFFASDGDWTPVVYGFDAWTAIAKPSSTSPIYGAYTDPDVYGAYTDLSDSGALTDLGDGWTPVLILD